MAISLEAHQSSMTKINMKITHLKMSLKSPRCQWVKGAPGQKSMPIRHQGICNYHGYKGQCRAHHFPLPDGLGQVKLPVRQVDFNRFFFFISYKQIEEFKKFLSWVSDYFEKRQALQWCISGSVCLKVINVWFIHELPQGPVCCLYTTRQCAQTHALSLQNFNQQDHIFCHLHH